MEIDPSVTAVVDEALATTRAVRRRLDLGRDVDDEIILECIDIAEQAPTGGNQGSRRWLIVRDPELKQRLAQMYRDVIGNRMIEARDRLAGTGDRRERTVRSSAHLAEHLGEVPAIVIPVILGRHDGSGRPGLFDSVIQSAWSFCVALRARGLGTVWTTAGLVKALGACFVGRNHHPARGDWEVPCIVDVFDEQAAFGWCTNDVDNPGARWRFELEPIVGGTRLRFRAIMGPGSSGLDAIIEARPDLEPRIIARRISEHRANMQRVVEGVKAAAEQS